MKKTIIVIIVGIVFGSIGVLGATYLYHANEVSYTPSNSNFNVDNVESAINELYGKVNHSKVETVILLYTKSVLILDKNGSYLYDTGSISTISDFVNNNIDLLFLSTRSSSTTIGYKIKILKPGYYIFSEMYDIPNAKYYSADETFDVDSRWDTTILYFGETNPMS